MQYQFKEVSANSARAIQGLFKKACGKSLVEAFHVGEVGAFDRLYAKYRKPIHRYVSQSVADQEQVEDLVQEIFLKVHRFRDSYQPQYALSTWLWTIARNTVSDSLRKNRFESSAESWIEEGDEIACFKPNAEVLLDRHLEKNHFKYLLSKLTELQRKVILMKVIQQLSYQEISKNLGLSISAVKCLVYRSRLVLSEAGCNLSVT